MCIAQTLPYSRSKEVQKLKFLQTTIILETPVSSTTIYSSICLNKKKKMSEENILPEKNEALNHTDNITQQ